MDGIDPKVAAAVIKPQQRRSRTKRSNIPERITEDDPRWDCKTMGTKTCEPERPEHYRSRVAGEYERTLQVGDRAASSGIEQVHMGPDSPRGDLYYDLQDKKANYLEGRLRGTPHRMKVPRWHDYTQRR